MTDDESATHLYSGPAQLQNGYQVEWPF